MFSLLEVGWVLQYLEEFNTSIDTFRYDPIQHGDSSGDPLDFLDIVQGLHVQDSLELLWVCLYAVLINHMSQELAEGCPEDTPLGVQLHIISAEAVKGLP